MNIRSKFSYVVAGFVGGMAFLISCSGGSGGSSVSEVEAAVPINQMVCQIPGGSLWNSTTSGIPNLLSIMECYDTSGTGRTISIADAYAEGWRIQIGLLAASDASGARYIFEK